MPECEWCSCPVDESRADIDGNHPSFSECVAALKRKVAALTQELIEERSLVAHLTDRLEVCRSCPHDIADP